MDAPQTSLRFGKSKKYGELYAPLILPLVAPLTSVDKRCASGRCIVNIACCADIIIMVHTILRSYADIAQCSRADIAQCSLAAMLSTSINQNRAVSVLS